MPKYVVYGSRGAKYECDTLAEAKKAAGKTGRIQKKGAVRKRNPAGPWVVVFVGNGQDFLEKGLSLSEAAKAVARVMKIMVRSGTSPFIYRYAGDEENYPTIGLNWIGGQRITAYKQDSSPVTRKEEAALGIPSFGKELSRRNPEGRKLTADQFEQAWKSWDFEALADSGAVPRRALEELLSQDPEDRDEDLAEFVGHRLRMHLEALREAEYDDYLLNRAAPFADDY